MVERILTLILMLGAFSALAQTVDSELTISVESEVFAKRGDIIVTHADFDARLARIPEGERSSVIASPKRISDLLEQLLLDRALAEEGIQSGLLEDQTIQALLWHSTGSILAQSYADRIVDKAELDDYTQQAREIWLSGKYHTDLPLRFDFTHLLISNTTRSEIQAAQLILELQSRVEQGESFQEIVEAYSEDPSLSENGGSFTEVPVNQLEREFAAALTELQTPGEISEPIRTEYGWHIIRLDERHAPRESDFEEALPILRQLARQRHRERVRDRLYARLSGQPREIQEGAVQQLLERYGLHQALTGEN